MHEYLILGYIATIIIGASAITVQITAKGKHLEADSTMMLSSGMTVFLGLVFVFNFCDFLTGFLGGMIGSASVQWIYVLQNVMEIVILYALLEVERRLTGSPKPWGLDIWFVVIGMSVLFGDSIHSLGPIYPDDKAYASVMFFFNLIPIIIVLVLGRKYLKSLKQSEGRRAYSNILLYNGLCVLLCIVSTATIIDQRTEYVFFVNDEIVYIVFWMAFNTANLVFVWKSILAATQESGGVAGQQRNEPLVEESSMAESVAVETHGESKEQGETTLESANEQDKLEKIFEKYALSQREREIALYILEGRNNKEIASAMYLSPNTVKVHASNLYKKLGASNRVQATRVLSGQETNSDRMDRSAI